LVGQLSVTASYRVFFSNLPPTRQQQKAAQPKVSLVAALSKSTAALQLPVQTFLDWRSACLGYRLHQKRLREEEEEEEEQ
jgi:hypothetical protein